MTIFSAGVGETIFGVIGNLIAHPNMNDAAVGLDGHQARMGLQVRLMNMLRRETILKNMVRLAKAAFDIA